jgi:hypothetical protein
VLLSGHPPSQPSGESISLDERLARLREPVKPVPDVDDDLMQLLLDGLAFEPTDRPTAVEFRDRLTALNLAGDHPTGAPTRPGATDYRDGIRTHRYSGRRGQIRGTELIEHHPGSHGHSSSGVAEDIHGSMRDLPAGPDFASPVTHHLPISASPGSTVMQIQGQPATNHCSVRPGPDADAGTAHGAALAVS